MSNSIKEQLANPIKPSDFYKILANHDWYYNFSDDGRVWRAGQAMEKCIVSCALRNPFANFMYCKFVDARTANIQGGTLVTSISNYTDLVIAFNNKDTNPPWEV
jgi:hypothetical protein